MKDNPLQEHFNTLNTLIVGEIINNKSPELDDELKGDLFRLTGAYNKVCRTLGYKIEHKTNVELLDKVTGV